MPLRARCAERCPIPGCYHLGKRAQHAKNGCKQCPPGEGCNGLADRRRAAAENASSVGTDGAVDGDDDAAAASDGLGLGPAAGTTGGGGAHGTDEFEDEGDPDVIQIDDHDEREIMSAVLTTVMDAVDEVINTEPSRAAHPLRTYQLGTSPPPLSLDTEHDGTLHRHGRGGQRLARRRGGGCLS